jgi:hypothetical protein
MLRDALTSPNIKQRPARKPPMRPKNNQKKLQNELSKLLISKIGVPR